MISEQGLLDKDKLLEIFSYLNERLKENQLQLEITVYGGSIMTLLYDKRPATKDIDCVFGPTNSKLLNNILELTRFTFGLSDNWINEQVKEPLKQLLKEDREIYQAHSNLTILKPRAKQLLAMKVLAARPEPAKDFVDAYLLCRDLGITTKAELLEIVSEYIPLKLVGERQVSFIRYLGEDLGYDWQ
jgi:hypothetical protein